MKIKNILASLLIFILITTNCTFAANWIPIKADNGKVAEIDIDSLEKHNSTVKYKIKQTKLENDVIYNMITDCNNKTTAILNMTIYKDGKQIGFEDYSKAVKYAPIKLGTLNWSAYKIITLANNAPALNVDKAVWEKYFKKQQKKIQKNWHPNLMTANHYPKERAIAYMTLVLDKNGNIVKRSYQNTTNTKAKYDKFNNRLKQEIEKPFDKIKFDPLPAEYKEENLIVIMKFEYSMEGDAKSKSISFNNTGIGYLECGKNNSGLIGIGALLAIPFVIVYYITIYPIKCIITAN